MTIDGKTFEILRVDYKSPKSWNKRRERMAWSGFELRCGGIREGYATREECEARARELAEMWARF